MAIINSQIAGVDKSGWEVIQRSSGSNSYTDADTSTHDIALMTLPGGYLRPNSRIRVVHEWDSPASNTTASTVAVFFGATQVYPLMTLAADGRAAHFDMHQLICNNSVTSQLGPGQFQFLFPNNYTTAGDNRRFTSYSVDFSADVAIKLQYQHGTASDELRLVSWQVEVLI